jgi:hypothetical protein
MGAGMSRKSTEQNVDEGVEETFPASDPVAAAQPDSSAAKRVRTGDKPAAPPTPPRKRSPDWLLEKK